MPDQTEKLQQEILADARRRAERNRKRAEQEAAKIIREAEEAVERLRQERLAQAEREAEQAARTILAGIDQEIRRNRLRRRERVFQEVFRTALKSLHDAPPAEARGTLARLTASALAQIGPGDKVRIHVRPDQAELVTPDFVEKAARVAFGSNADAPAFEVIPDPEIHSGGVLVESGDGRRLCDNTFEARLRRLELDLRPRILEILETGLEQSPPAPTPDDTEKDDDS